MPIFPPLISQAIAWGMVSNQNERLSVPESRQRFRSAERLKIYALMCK
jgi:hypothetical protein